MRSESQSVAVLATLDTKGEEAAFLAARLREHGMQVRVIDLGLRGDSAEWAEIEAAELASIAGTTLSAPKPERMDAVARGAGMVLNDWLADGTVGGVVGIGGGQGTWLVTSIYKQLPLELPKVLVTTLANRAGGYIGTADVAVIPSITDIAGLNPILRGVLARAAGAVAGMVRVHGDAHDDSAAFTAMTMFGVTTVGATAVRTLLETAGLEIGVFHANGSGGAVMEQLIRQGQVRAVLDFTTTELADEMLGGIASAGPARLTAASEIGIPQLVVPGAIDIVNFGAPESVPSRFADRNLFNYTPNATLLRVEPDESVQLGRVVAEKLNASAGRVTVVLPEQGFSALGGEGEAFHHPASDQAFIETLQAALNSRHRSVIAPMHINDSEFARVVGDEFLELTSHP